ncbi:putative RING-H2 finger protein ATL21B [Beta vulgaris subsp. vulgaris]|uniref:putative RING-H2 finger protein ATL21B n=1 Tax=Beta vulgaris subsp. vulgaris TaxID=3555 RepID=UPI002036F4E1|nr:putative RING-H2 finger protein ATL21B [Beta vulgaris subsp. vulgaris]
MKILKKKIFFLLIIFSYLICTQCAHQSSDMADYCVPQVCNYNEPFSRNVQFPFLINNDSMPSFCGYPGFDLLCNEDDKLLIDLPDLGAFTVKDIDYVNQELWLNDPDDCLPRKLISLNGTSFVGKSSFLPNFEQDYWFYNCSNDYFNSSNHVNIRVIECLSGTNYGVFAIPLERSVNSSLCRKIGPIKVPIGPYEEDFSSSLRGDIRLTWYQPLECGECYERHGRCKFKSNSNLEVECFNVPRQGFSRNALVAIAFALAAPLGLVTFCIVYFAVKAIIYRQRHLRGVTPDLTATSQPQTVVRGLDRAVIEAYPEVVLGESRRLPKPDDMNCPICLGEYLPKESLRTIPDCGHCFHAECIDAWLHLNASCPICRNAPSKGPDNTT